MLRLAQQLLLLVQESAVPLDVECRPVRWFKLSLGFLVRFVESVDQLRE